MTSGTPLLLVEGLTCRFGEVFANDGVSFRVQPGEIHAVLGENGAGKSTLVKLVYGVYRPDEGEMHFDGPRLHRRPAAAGGPDPEPAERLRRPRRAGHAHRA